MGTLFSTLDIARSGLQVAQVQLDVTAHNIANVNKEGYSRQRVELAARIPNSTPFGQIGRGVAIARIARLRETFLDTAYRRVAPRLGLAELQTQYYGLVEDIFLEPTEAGFSTRLNALFDSLSDYANNVESLPLREGVIAEAQTMASALNNVASRLYQLRTSANDEIRDSVPELNSLTSRISDLNRLIRDAEVGGSQANDLRDDRDNLVDQLSQMLTVKTIEDTHGNYVILAGDRVLVDTVGARELYAFRNDTIDPDRQDLFDIRFVEDDTVLDVTSGSLGAAFNMRDDVIKEVSDRLDTLTAAMIREINRVHSQGNGIENLSGNLLGSIPVDDPTALLNAADLPFSISAGSIDVIVYDAAGTPTTTTVNYDPATMSLNDVAAALNAVGNFSAAVVGDRLQLGADAGFTYSFANDTGGLLVGTGIHGLFTGTDARSIAINSVLQEHPAWLTSGYSTDVAETGDNTAALAMAAVRNSLVLNGNTATINDYYQAIVAQIGIDGRSNNEDLDIERAFVQDFERRRQEVSGVSIDEEVTFLMQYQRAFEASARVITITDSMLETLLNIVR